MFPTSFPQANKVLGPPAGVTEEQCSSLPIHTDGQNCISRWDFTAEERQQIADGAPLFVTVWSGVTQPPIDLSPSDPWNGGAVRMRELPDRMVLLRQLEFMARQAREAGLEFLGNALTDLNLLERHGLGDVAAATLREIAAPIWKAAEEEPPAPAEIPS